MSPRNPLMSPLFGDLSNLPPTLVQASDCEMLLDDSVRYVNKARSQGSPVTLQIWPEMVHVWLVDRREGPFFTGMYIEPKRLVGLLTKRRKERGKPW